jgi:predicted  nucleic acid-binding Zn-ribbon protein
VSTLETLLALQDRDMTLDRLSHRRAALPERATVAHAESQLAALTPRLLDARARRDEVSREERRLDDDARGLEQRAAEVEKRLYSGEVSSPRELQAMQADIEQLRRHRSSVEDEELAQMERRETLDNEVAQIEAQLAEIDADLQAQRDALRVQEAALDEEIAGERRVRDQLVGEVTPAMLQLYDRCRTEARGVGVARLVGRTCQGCHLDIPFTEAEQIRREAEGTVAHCDNCGCILVPV